MLRQILFAFIAVLTFTAPATAQRTFEIPGIGTIQFGGGGHRQRVDPRHIEERYKVLDRKSNRNNESRVIFDVGGRQGRFSELRIRAIGKVVRITGLEVVFGNGKSQLLDVYQPIQPGEVSPALDLTGDARAIRRVILTKRRTWQRERGEIELLGRPDEGDHDGRFSVLDTKRLGVSPRQDLVFNEINSRDRWDKIRIKVLDSTVFIDDVEIVFANGKRQSVDVEQRLGPGQQTRDIPLEGRNARRIQRIDVEVRRFGRSRGRLQILGISDRRRSEAPPPRRRASHQTVPAGWVLFGSETVGSRAERQVLHIGKDAGVFDRITFRAQRNDIHIRDVTIVYGNGARDRRNIDLLVPAGYGTPPIDLNTRRNSGRYIRDIIVTYRSEGRRWGNNTALLQVFGEYSEGWLRDSNRGGLGDNWIRLGARRAAMFSKDNDAILVGKRFGRFRAVKVRVIRNEVKLYGMTITYANGTSESVPVYGKLDAGQSSQSFDLEGRRRFIERIDLRYRTKFSLQGDGIVEVWGRR